MKSYLNSILFIIAIVVASWYLFAPVEEPREIAVEIIELPETAAEIPEISDPLPLADPGPELPQEEPTFPAADMAAIATSLLQVRSRSSESGLARAEPLDRLLDSARHCALSQEPRGSGEAARIFGDSLAAAHPRSLPE